MSAVVAWFGGLSIDQQWTPWAKFRSSMIKPSQPTGRSWRRSLLVWFPASLKTARPPSLVTRPQLSTLTLIAADASLARLSAASWPELNPRVRCRVRKRQNATSIVRGGPRRRERAPAGAQVLAPLPCLSELRGRLRQARGRLTSPALDPCAGAYAAPRSAKPAGFSAAGDP